jgi:hypothetical protein
MLDWPSLVTSSNCRLVLSLLSDWCNFSGIPLAVEIPYSWVEPVSGVPDGRFKHSARVQGVGAGLDSWGKTAMWAFSTLLPSMTSIILHTHAFTVEATLICDCVIVHILEV